MLSTLNSKKALLVFVAFLFAFGNLLPALAITSGESTLPRISYWPGKVNQHTENGVWKTDPDGVSGSTTSWTADNILTYCKKWYPNTASVVSDGTISTIDWKAAGNTGSYSSIRPVYRCVQPVSAPDLTFSGFGTNGPDANNNNTVLLVPSIKNIGTAPFAGNLTVSVDISKNNVLITNESFVRNIGLDINMGNFTTYRTQYSFVDSGTYTIKLTLQNVSGETNTSNNTTSAEVTVAGTANYAGKLIKGDSDSNLFYLGTDNKKYVIPSLTGYDAYKNAVLDSWGLVAENAIIISQSQLSSYPIGGNMTIKANTYKLKLENRAEIYNVEYDNYIKQVDSVANHPAGWNDFVIVPDPFFVNYRLLETAAKPDLVVSDIKYVVNYKNYQDNFLVATACNNGTENVSSTVRGKFSSGGQYISYNLFIAADLAKGQCSEVSIQSQYFSQFVDANNNINITFEIDDINQVAESNEDNNTLTKTITVAGAAVDTDCQVTLEGITYQLSPCEIKTSMIDGDGGKTVAFKIDQVGTAKSYGFSVYGYGEGFPTYGIITTPSSGGASGDKSFEATFRDNILDANGDQAQKYSGYLPIKVYHGSAGTGVEKTLKLMVELDVLPKTTTTDTNCQITLEGITYKLSPCEINTSMTDGAGDKEFSFKIDQVSETRSYGFGVYGYGEGFPTYGIITTPSSGAHTGDLSFKSVFKDQILNAENNQTKNYTGYLPIKIYYGSAGTGVEKTLKLMVNVNVSPAANLDSTPRISYWPGKVNQHTENGVWKTDPDGVSGSYTSWTIANILTYCKKWYPNTTSVEADGTISTIDWKAAGNTGSYSSIRPVYKCVQPTNKADLKITDLFLEDGLVKANYCNVGNYQPLISGSPATFYIKLSANGAVHTGTSNNSNHVFSVPAPGECQKTDGIPASYFNFVGGRSYLVEANIDWENRVAESNENNNIFSKVVTPESIPVSGLSLVKNSAYGNQNFVPPATQAKVASFIVSAGANSGVDIDTINISQATSGVMQNMKLMTGSTQSGATKVTLTSSNTTENVFTISNLNLAAGESKIVDVYADIKANPDSSSFTLAINALGTNSQGVAVSTTDQAMQTIRLVNGSLSASADSSQPVSGLVVAGTTAKMNAIKFTATNEAFTITKLRISESNPENLDSIAKVILEYKDKGGNTNIKEAYLNNDNVVDFTGLNMYVPKDGSAILTVKAEIPTIASGADSGDTPGLDFSSVNFSALGESSNVAKISGLSNVMGNDMVVRKSIPTITTQSLPTTILSNGTQILYKFRVLVDPAGDIAWQKISLQLKTDGAVGIAGGSLYSETDQSTKLGTGTIDDALIMEFSLPTAEIVAAGSMKTYVIKATVTNATNSMVSLTSLGDGGSGTMVPDSVADISDHSNFIWSDMSKVPALTSLTDNVWLDGSLVKTFGDSAVLISTSYAAPVALSKAESVIGTEDSAPSTVMNIGQRLSGRLLLAVEDRGRIFYVYPVDYKKYEVTFGNITELFESLALGISNSDLDKILINPDSVSADKDSDGDGFNDKSEVANGYNPYLASDPANRGNDKVVVDNDLANRLIGRLLLQVEDRGRIWYVDQAAKRWEVTWENVMNLFTSLSLGISNEDLAKMENGN